MKLPDERGRVRSSTGPADRFPDSPEVNVDGIAYDVLEDPAQIERYVLGVADAEWDPEDFDEFGADLLGQHWSLECVPVASIRPQQALLDSAAFQADVQPRIAAQRSIHGRGESVPPLILRGSDFLIFDGYARWHYFEERRIARCLAYVGRQRTNPASGAHERHRDPEGPDK